MKATSTLVSCLNSRSGRRGGRQVLQTSIPMTSRMNSTWIHFRCSFFFVLFFFCPTDRPTITRDGGGGKRNILLGTPKRLTGGLTHWRCRFAFASLRGMYLSMASCMVLDILCQLSQSFCVSQKQGIDLKRRTFEILRPKQTNATSHNIVSPTMFGVVSTYCVVHANEHNNCQHCWRLSKESMYSGTIILKRLQCVFPDVFTRQTLLWLYANGRASPVTEQ